MIRLFFGFRGKTKGSIKKWVIKSGIIPGLCYMAYWEIRIASVVKAPITATSLIFFSLNNLYAAKHINI